MAKHKSSQPSKSAAPLSGKPAAASAKPLAAPLAKQPAPAPVAKVDPRPVTGMSPADYARQSKALAKKAQKQLEKTLPARSRKSSPFSIFFLRALLGWFIISLFTCSPNTSPSTSYLCYPSARYHSTVQPYVQPHLSNAISAAKPYYEPYLNPILPHYNRAHSIITPTVNRISKACAPHLQTLRRLSKRTYDLHLAPRLHQVQVRADKVFGPYINMLRLRWRFLIQPYIDWIVRIVKEAREVFGKDARIQMIRRKGYELARSGANFGLDGYSRVVKPAVGRGIAGAKHHWYATLIPAGVKSYYAGKHYGYVGSTTAVQKANLAHSSSIQPFFQKIDNLYLNKVYYPYLSATFDPIFAKAQPVISKVSPVISKFENTVALVLNQIQQFLSPYYAPLYARHFAPQPETIIDKVKHAIHPDAAAVASSSLAAASRTLAAQASSQSSLAAKTASSLSSLASASASSASLSASSLASVASRSASSLSVQAASTSSSLASVASKSSSSLASVASVSAASASSVASVSLASASSVASVSASKRSAELASSSSSLAKHLASSTSSAQAYASSIAAQAARNAAPGWFASSSTDEQDDEDVEFLAALASASDPASVQVPEIHEPELPPLAGEDDTRAELRQKEKEKKQAVKEMREEIEKKHVDFEQKLQRVGDVEEEKLIEKLASIRSRAVSSFPSSNIVSSLEKDGEKLVRTLEKHFGKHFGKASSATKEDVDSAVSEAAETFSGKVDGGEDTINNWLKEVEVQEEKAVAEHGEAVDSIVREAQEALGMAYAWLEDVTAKDWTRYHDLTDAATKRKASFSHHSNSQTSHPSLSTPETDLDASIRSFRSELEQIEDGFAARAGVVKNDILRRILDTQERHEDSGYESTDDSAIPFLAKGAEQVKDALKSAGEAVGIVKEEEAKKEEEKIAAQAAEKLKAAFDWFAHGSL